MSFFDLIENKKDDVLTGVYYARRPIVDGYNGANETVYSDSGIPFRYDILGEQSQAYKTMLGTLRADSVNQTIKTDADIEFKINGYIKGQDGGFYQITEILTQIAPPEHKQSLRWFKTTIKTTRTIRMIGVDNPFEL
jgi:hypothetical protein